MKRSDVAIASKRFFARLDMPVDGCWEWQGTKCSDGYGNLYVKIGGKRKVVGTHRAAWALEMGDIPDGFQVLHRCDNPACCRISHLFLGTARDNMRDMVSKRRHSSQTKPERVPRGDSHFSRHSPEKLARGSRHGSARLNEVDVREILLRLDCETVRSIADSYGVSQRLVRMIRENRIWKHVSRGSNAA